MKWLKRAHTVTNVIFVDFDRTILDDKGIFGEKMVPFPDVRDALEQLSQAGYEICIYSCRSNDKEGRDSMLNILLEYSIPYDKIVDGKPEYTYLIDDRAIECTDGNWEEILKKLLSPERALESLNKLHLGRREKEVLDIFSDGKRHSISDISQKTGISEFFADFDVSVLLQFELLDWDEKEQTAGITDLGREYLES